MKKLALILCILFPAIIVAQTKTTLPECMKAMENNFPLAKNISLIKKTNSINADNLSKNFLPQVNLSGQATYQSDVTSLPIEIPNISIPQVGKDMYRLNVDINQMIYDGGATKQFKEANKIEGELKQQSVKVELYKLKQKVQEVYFNVLFLEQTQKLLIVLKSELNEKHKTIRSAVENGVMLTSNADVIEAEIINIEQKIEEIQIGLNTSIKIINELTSLNLTKETIFKIPDFYIHDERNSTRPEYKLFELQKSNLGQMKELTKLGLMPKLIGFGQVGYGRPGLNMLSNTFDPYYIIGAKITWSPFDWGKAKNKRTGLDYQSQMIDVQKEIFDIGMNNEVASKLAEIEKFEKMIKKDKSIIKLRNSIAMAASSQLDNGVITSTDYITIKNTEIKAILNFELHKLNLINARINYLFTLGKL